MDVPTYPSFQRPTVAGLVKTGRLKPLPAPRIGKHSDEHSNPQAVTPAELARRVADPAVVAWLDAQQATDTRRIARVALPALDGAA